MTVAGGKAKRRSDVNIIKRFCRDCGLLVLETWRLSVRGGIGSKLAKIKIRKHYYCVEMTLNY
ncbi:hypothetical protein E2C01_102450 [Portunus trituberculatus]|uniref:Uncharacterized protein n=1 Tax=Portunus trituberculatus TaxID=210409 RepID=A0A5B7KIK1_PORTR|nr:hypothetical protein [Portunus trituberculatus]